LNEVALGNMRDNFVATDVSQGKEERL